MRRGITRSKRGAPEAVTLTVERIGARGDGIARHRGEPVFLPFTVPGERVAATLGPARGEGREGRVVERLSPGPGRVEPACPHFGRCGGCALQHLGPALYDEVKLGGLRTALVRAGLDPGVVRPLRRVADAARRRVRLGLFRPADPARPGTVGLRERFGHRLVDLRHCAVLDPALFALVAPLRRILPDLLAPGSAAEAGLTRCDSGVDLLVESAAAPGLRALEALAALGEEADLGRIVWLGPDGDRPIVERRPARIVMSGVPVELPPGAFLQASAEAEQLLVGEAVAAIEPNAPALDLFAGLGAFTFALAQQPRRVHAVEGDAAAACALVRAARPRPQVSVERRDLARDPLPAPALSLWGAAVFDPPRAGARAQAEELARSTVATVVAISCNPATFARDAQLLVRGGFRLESVTPVDQFVWTPHLELAAVFRR